VGSSDSPEFCSRDATELLSHPLNHMRSEFGGKVTVTDTCWCRAVGIWHVAWWARRTCYSFRSSKQGAFIHQARAYDDEQLKLWRTRSNYNVVDGPPGRGGSRSPAKDLALRLVVGDVAAGTGPFVLVLHPY